MSEQEMMAGILDSYPYPIVFVDGDFVIRYLNRYAKYHYYQERGYSDLIGHSLFDCHDSEQAKARIRSAWEGICRNGKEVFIGVNAFNQRIYMQGVRGANGQLIGFFERFELNLQK